MGHLQDVEPLMPLSEIWDLVPNCLTLSMDYKVLRPEPQSSRQTVVNSTSSLVKPHDDPKPLAMRCYFSASLQLFSKTKAKAQQPHLP